VQAHTKLKQYLAITPLACHPLVQGPVVLQVLQLVLSAVLE
jgi:hypothetical protein